MNDITLILGDCKEEVKKLESNSIDSCVCDPPAGIHFMANDWDVYDKAMFGIAGDEGKKDLKVKKNFKILPRYTNSDLLGFQDYIFEIFTEVLRVLKPGAHALVWAIPRTSHHTAMGLERAGFEIRDCITHIFAQGFPKSLNIGKAIDKQKKAKREIIGQKRGQGNIPNDRGNWGLKSNIPIDITIPNTDEAKQWEGWGTALKPAAEFWWLVRKPLNEKTIVANVLKYGTGGLNIDACKIKHNEDVKHTKSNDTVFSNESCGFNSKKQTLASADPNGRFPANFIIDCICDEVIVEPIKVTEPSEVKGGIFSPSQGHPAGKTYKGGKRIHTNPDCPCYILDQQSGERKGCANQNHSKFNPYGGNALLKSKTEREGIYKGYNDIGGASRFFYNPKASTSERNKGCEELELKENLQGLDIRGRTLIREDGTKTLAGRFKSSHKQNNHPTVKPIALMKYLITLITPKNGIVIDPFMGSGSTGVAAKELGFNFIGIEKDKEYFNIAEKRINHAKENMNKGLNL